MTQEQRQKKASAMNLIFVFFLAGAILFAAFTGKMKEVSEASFEAAKAAVTLAISLVGIMAFWLGLVRIIEAGGLLQSLAKGIRPLLEKLFPDVPADHPALGAMILNIAANMLGLGNAATPLGIKAMVELDKLNPFKGTATNAMALFLAINTSSVTILPLGTIGVRAAAGSKDPAGIFIPTLIATSISTAVGIIVALFFAAKDKSYQHDYSQAMVSYRSTCDEEKKEETSSKHDLSHLLIPVRPSARFFAWAFPLILIVALCWRGFVSLNLGGFIANEVATYWLMPALMILIVSYGLGRGVKIYDAVTEGGKQGFDIALRIIPFLVAILVVIAMFRASGAMEFIGLILNPITGLIGMPADVLPMALVRPLSGTGAFGIMSSLIQNSPDSYSAYLASILMGSSETTFYVLAVYFGAIGIVRLRHALIAAIMADLAGILGACAMARIFY